LTNENIEHVCNVVQSGQQKSIQEISVETVLSAGSIHSIIHKHLNTHYPCQHLNPKMPTPEEKET
jgi:hypothetical protein